MSEDPLTETIGQLLEDQTDYELPEDASVMEYDVDASQVQYFDANSHSVVVTATVVSKNGLTSADFRFHVHREQFNEAMDGFRL